MKKLIVLLLYPFVASLFVTPAPAAASTPSEQNTLTICTSLKTGSQMISKTGKCNERIYESRTWYKKGTAPSGTPGYDLLDLRTCVSKSSNIQMIRTGSACSVKTQSTFLWQRPLGPPVAPLITSVAMGVLGTATLNIAASAEDGGARVTSYLVASTPGGIKATFKPDQIKAARISGLIPGNTYSFTVFAINSKGSSPASISSKPTIAPSIPSAPTITKVVATGTNSAQLTFTAPTNDGGSPITSYVATSHPGGLQTIVYQSGSGTMNIANLSHSTSYTFSLVAQNEAGPSLNSPASTLITTAKPSQSLVEVLPTPTSTTVSTAAIAGVTAPVTGATPVTTTTAGTGYTGTVSWASSGGALIGNFAGATTYTATITLTPTSGYTLTGVIANFFTVAGATSITHSENSGFISAVFPATIKLTQSIVITSFPADISYGASPAALAAVSTSGLPVVFTSATTPVCTVSGTSLTILTVGTCTINANQAGNTNFAAASQVSGSFTVSKATPILSNFAHVSKNVGDSSFNLNPPTVANSLPGLFSYTSATTATATISGETVTIGSSGSSLVTATFTPTDTIRYNNATITMTLSVGLAAQAPLSISSLTTNSKAYPYTQALSITTSGGSGTGAVTFAIASGGTATECVLSNSTSTATITALTVGTCLIQASKAADSTYSAATSATATFTFTAANQTITFATPTAMTLGGSTQSVAPTASSSLTVTLTSTTTGICTVAGLVITAVATGTCSITASQTGSSNYLAASDVIQSFAIKATQTITFATPSAMTVGGSTQTVAPTASSSLTVTLTSTTTGICTVTGFVITAVATGTCSITASQAGDANFLSATDLIRSFAIQVVINTAAIAGVTAPVTGATPVATTTAGTGYTGTVSWASSGGALVGNFAGAIIYTATITLTPTSGYTLTGVTANFFTVAGATSVTHLANSGVITVEFPRTLGYCDGTSFTCRIGDTGPGGGKIFYVASGTFTQVGATGSMCTTNCKYLEAAPNTGVNAWTDAAYVWSGNTTQAIGATARGTAIGTGYANTLAIVGQISGGDASNRAGTISRAYRGPNNQSDWYLPSESEILELYSKRTIVGASWSGSHWTSSETTTDPVRARAHGSGMYSPEKKDALLVRPIRAFALPTTIATAAIAGVTAPVTGATPVTTTTAGTGYTGTVSWTSSGGALVGNFAGATAYTATITLTPTSGYTLTGVTANFFTVTGGTTVTNLADSGVITAVFPATATTIATAAIAGVTAPVTGATPVATTTAGTGYTGTVSWTSSPSTFASVTSYTATITLTPTSGYTLTGVTANFFTVAGATSVTHLANSGVITVEFPRTLGYCDGSTFNCQVGDTGPGGGKVFYVSVSGFNCGPTFSATGYGGGKCYYLEAAPSTWSGGSEDPRISWSTGANQTVAVLDARETAIGSGYKNSLAIVAQSGNVAATSAAVAAREYRGPNNQSDWYLPSKDELNEMFINREAAGATAGYWSSSEATATGAWDQGFSNGGQGVADPGKQQTTPVRPIRAFGPPTTIATAAIAGVTAPVTGATPVATTTSGIGYTGTVSWASSGGTLVGNFAGATAYTATITLTPTSGYTLTGVTANFFTVAGATSVTHSANTGVITAVFPATLAAPAFTLSSSSESRTVNTVATGFTINSTGGDIASFAISPAAPAGMNFNLTTGAFTGTPSTVAGATNFTVTATNASGSATQIFTLTVTEVTCANGGTCNVGDRGPGGGVVFYVSATYFTSTGSTCNTACRYLEVAPSTWQSGGLSVADDPSLEWSTNRTETTGQDRTTASNEGIESNSWAEKLNWRIGQGFYNTSVMKVTGATSNAQAAVLAYAGSSVPGQWFIPSMNELNELCKYARGQATGDLKLSCTSGGTLKSTANAGSDLGGFVSDLYWSSSELSANVAMLQSFADGSQPGAAKGALHIRPIRAFGP